MLSSNSLKRRVFASLGVTLAAAVVLISLSASAAAQQTPASTSWPVLQIANPSPGALVLAGDYVISGTAFDPAATQGSGVSHVDLFLGPRDQGGLFLGSAMPGHDAMTGLLPDSTAAQNSFQVTVTVPSTITGGREFWAYAYSSVTGSETSVSMPVNVGAVPTEVPTPAAPAAQIQHLSGPPSGGLETFSLGNPSAGAVVLYGNYEVSGVAGPMIDRVTLFLDERDAGGTPLGSATPVNGTFSVIVKIPTSANGGHTFTAYASSSATGQETKVSVPIFVGTAPTPTPHPS